MAPWTDRRLPSWPCLMSAPRLTRSIMTSFYCASLLLLASLANLLTGSAHSYAIAPPVLFPGRPGPTGPLPHLGYHKVLFWARYYTYFTLPKSDCSCLLAES